MIVIKNLQGEYLYYASNCYSRTRENFPAVFANMLEAGKILYEYNYMSEEAIKPGGYYEFVEVHQAPDEEDMRTLRDKFYGDK